MTLTGLNRRKRASTTQTLRVILGLQEHLTRFYTVALRLTQSPNAYHQDQLSLTKACHEAADRNDVDWD